MPFRDDVPDLYAELRASGDVRPVAEVTSWLGADYLGAVPIVGGQVSDDESDLTRTSVTLTVPASPDMLPAGPKHPLGRAGQVLRVRCGLRTSLSRTPVVWVGMGNFRVMEADVQPGADTFTVVGHAAGLKTVELARFLQADTTLPAETLAARVRWLCSPMTPVVFDTRLVDRGVPSTVQGEHDRAAALAAALEAWPAVAEQRDGFVWVRPPYAADGTVAEVEYADGEGGSLVSLDPVWPADLVPNASVVTGAGSAAGSAATDVGPTRWAGPYGFVPEFYASPLLTTAAQCRDVAVARLQRAQRRVYRVKATLVPDWRVQPGTIARFRSGATTDVVARVATVEHPLTAEDGLTTVEAAVLYGVLADVHVDDVTVSTSSLLDPASLTYGRTVIPVMRSSTWSDGVGWRTDTTDLRVGRDDQTVSRGYAWWGAAPAWLPGTIVAASLHIVAAGEQSAGKTTVALLASAYRPAGRPVELATAEGPTPTDEGVDWPIPADWLARLDAGEAGGIGLSTDGQAFTVSAQGQSLALQIDWRR